MLGSLHDGDDLVQETMLRAWRARVAREDPSRLQPWLYRKSVEVRDGAIYRMHHFMQPDLLPPFAQYRT